MVLTEASVIAEDAPPVLIFSILIGTGKTRIHADLMGHGAKFLLQVFRELIITD